MKPGNTNKDHKFKYFKGNTNFYSKNQLRANSIPIFMKIAVMFSNVLGFIGIVFTLLGFGFLVLILSVIDFKSANVPNDSPIIDGEIISVNATNTYVNDQRVYEYYYTYSAPDGIKYSGSSYSRNRSDKPGDIVDVKYNIDSPGQSFIVGMNNEEFPKIILLFILIFPIIGVVLLYFGVKKGSRNVKIIEYGKISSGTYNRRESTNATVNKKTVYKFYFDFTADDGNNYIATGETHNTYKLEDEYKEPIIYNSVNPSEAVLVDTLPASVRRFFKVEIENELLKNQ